MSTTIFGKTTVTAVAMVAAWAMSPVAFAAITTPIGTDARFYTADDNPNVTDEFVNNGTGDGDARWNSQSVGSPGSPGQWIFNTDQVAVNPVTGSATKAENAIAFDGSFGGLAQEFAGSDSTVSFELLARPGALTDGTAILFDTGGSANGLTISMDLNTTDATPTPVVRLRTENGFIDGSLVGIDTSDFIHIVAVFDGAASDDGLKLYLNGVLKAEDDFADSDTAGTNDAGLGVYNGGGHANSFPNNFIGDIAVFTYIQEPLTASQVADRYNNDIIPEPGSMALLSLGGMFMLARRRKV